jgi:hypothetical protein
MDIYVYVRDDRGRLGKFKPWVLRFDIGVVDPIIYCMLSSLVW